MATYNEIVAGVKADTKKVNSLKLSDYEKKAKKSVASDRKKEQKTINTSFDSQKTNTQAIYNKNIEDTKTAYNSEYQKNAVQKIINENKVSERNANLGLTDSGLNRTQQTAVQLSYANQKGSLDIARQNAIDNLTLGLTTALTDIENNRNSAILASNQKWDSEARSMAQTNYNNDLTAYNNRIISGYEQLSEISNAQIEADAAVKKASINASGGADENKNSASTIYRFAGFDEAKNKNIYYGSDGKTYYFDVGINPYVSVNNTNSAAVKKYGVFSNGYQPKGVIQNGIDYGKLKVYDTVDAEESITGVQQNVWYTADTDKYWMWDGSSNQYVEVYNAGINQSGGTIWRAK